MLKQHCGGDSTGPCESGMWVIVIYGKAVNITNDSRCLNTMLFYFSFDQMFFLKLGHRLRHWANIKTIRNNICKHEFTLF